MTNQDTRLDALGDPTRRRILTRLRARPMPVARPATEQRSTPELSSVAEQASAVAFGTVAGVYAFAWMPVMRGISRC